MGGNFNSEFLRKFTSTSAMITVHHKVNTTRNELFLSISKVAVILP